MRKFIKRTIVVVMLFISICGVACGVMKNSVAEKVTLAKVVLNEVEFENSDKVELKQNNDEIKITGEIEAMSKAQKSAFGVNDATHVFVIKFEFDDERTIDSFEIKGDITKVYSTDKNTENYVDSISNLLDNKPSEDAYCNLILSANTKNYILTCKYSDSTESVIKITVDADLVTAVSE